MRPCKGKIPQPRHVDIEPVLVDRFNKTGVKVKVPLKKDNSAPQVVVRSGWVLKPPKRLDLRIEMS